MLTIFLLVLGTQCFLSAAATAAEGDLPNAADVQAKCQEEYKLDEEAVALLNRTRYLETSDQKIKCFVKCILTGFKVMNETGEVTLEDVRNRRPKALPHFEKCAGVNGTDPCDKAVNFQNCLLKEVEPEVQQPPE